jgi:hypothetical protein
MEVLNDSDEKWYERLQIRPFCSVYSAEKKGFAHYNTYYCHNFGTQSLFPILRLPTFEGIPAQC